MLILLKTAPSERAYLEEKGEFKTLLKTWMIQTLSLDD